MYQNSNVKQFIMSEWVEFLHMKIADILKFWALQTFWYIKVIKILTYQNLLYIRISFISEILSPTYCYFWHISILKCYNFRYIEIWYIAIFDILIFWHIGISGVPKFWHLGIMKYENFTRICGILEFLMYQNLWHQNMWHIGGVHVLKFHFIGISAILDLLCIGILICLNFQILIYWNLWNLNFWHIGIFTIGISDVSEFWHTRSLSQ